MSLLPIIEEVDSFPYAGDEFYWQFRSHQDALLGYIVPEIAARMLEPALAHYFDVDQDAKVVKISSNLSDFEKRNAALAEIASQWRDSDQNLALGWRDELYTVFSPRAVPYMLLERAFSVLLGVVTYGVHINGYVPAEKTSDGILKMWIPRRSATKATYPGKLDNTIAGGLAYPHGIWENVVKECWEEGGLDSDFVHRQVRAAGVISYTCQPYGLRGHVQPEVEYIYDLEFLSESENAPHPVDGEAEDFQLMSIDEVRLRVLAGEFKPNCGLVIADFLIRHGHVTPENEPNYMEIVSRLHRRFPFATRG